MIYLMLWDLRLISFQQRFMSWSGCLFHCPLHWVGSSAPQDPPLTGRVHSGIPATRAALQLKHTVSNLENSHNHIVALKVKYVFKNLSPERAFFFYTLCTFHRKISWRCVKHEMLQKARVQWSENRNRKSAQ